MSTRFRVFIVCSLAAFFYLYEFMVRVIPSAMMAPMMQHFSVGIAGIGWVSAAFFYGYVPMQVPSGLLLDSFGGRRLLSCAILLCAVSCCVFAYVHSIAFALLLRFIMGITGSVAFTGALYVAAGWIAREYFGFYSGLVQTLGCVGAILGQAPVAYLQTMIGYSDSQIAIGVIGIVFAGLIYFIVRDPKQGPASHADHPLDALTHSSWWSRFAIVLSNRQNWVIGVYGFLSWAPINLIASLWGIPFLMRRYAIAASDASWYMAAAWIGVAVSSPLIAIWSRKSRDRIYSMLFCIAAGLLGLYFMLYGPTLSSFGLLTTLFVFGCSAAAQPIAFDMIYANNPRSCLGTALGYANMAVIGGGVLLQPLVGILISWHAGHKIAHLSAYSLQDFHSALLVVPLCLVINLFIVLFCLSKKLRSTSVIASK